MPLSVSGTGSWPYVQNSVSGSPGYTGVGSYAFFSGLVTVNFSYVASPPDPTILIFGTVLSELVMINNGSNDLVFQWPELYGTVQDCGVVLANSTIILRRCFKTGMKLRCGESGQQTTCLIWGV
jgi:hypothetical protein